MGQYFNVNDTKIYLNRFYAYQYTEDLRVNLIPIGYFTLLQAKVTIQGQFGKRWRKYGIKLVLGKRAIKKSWSFGVNSVKIPGKNHIQLKQMYIPPEWNMNKRRRKRFKANLRKNLKDKNRSSINKFLKQYYLWIL